MIMTGQILITLKLDEMMVKMMEKSKIRVLQELKTDSKIAAEKK
jgi:hypothetical protein